MKPLLALAFVFYTASASAQIIVNTGDDIVAICNAAPSGSVIQIQSDAVFVGQHTWSAKELTIEAAPGFSPTLRGPVDNNLHPVGARQSAHQGDLQKPDDRARSQVGDVPRRRLSAGRADLGHE
jgi:hypothetical protein